MVMKIELCATATIKNAEIDLAVNADRHLGTSINQHESSIVIDRVRHLNMTRIESAAPNQMKFKFTNGLDFESNLFGAGLMLLIYKYPPDANNRKSVARLLVARKNRKY